VALRDVVSGHGVMGWGWTWMVLVVFSNLNNVMILYDLRNYQLSKVIRLK